LAHLDEVSLPSDPLIKRLTISRCRSLNSTLAKRSGEARLAEHPLEDCLRAVEGAAEALEKPHVCGQTILNA
jgi:hypothetical protein